MQKLLQNQIWSNICVGICPNGFILNLLVCSFSYCRPVHRFPPLLAQVDSAELRAGLLVEAPAPRRLWVLM